MERMISTSSGPALHPREIEIRAVSAMAAEVREAGTGLPPLMKSDAGPDREVLHHIAQLIVGDVAPQLAMTDPARYRQLSRLRTELILRGYYPYLQQLAATT